MFPLAFCLNRDGGASLGIISMVRLGLKGHGNLTHAKPRTGDAAFRVAGDRPLRAGCLKGSGDLADVDHLTRTAPTPGLALRRCTAGRSGREHLSLKRTLRRKASARRAVRHSAPLRPDQFEARSRVGIGCAGPGTHPRTLRRRAAIWFNVSTQIEKPIAT